MNPTLTTLKGGLRVVLVPCEAESVAFGLFINSGSRQEPSHLAGISHFIEHMVFKGTPTRKPVDISNAIEGRGGNFNAATGEESTCYYTHLPYEYLRDAISIISDMFLNATFEEEEFVREKAVVLEEIKMYEDDPGSVASENLQRAIFPRNSLGCPVAGGAKTLNPLTPQDLRNYVKTHYTAKRTVAVVVGHFKEDEALKMIDEILAAPLRARKTRDAKSYAKPIDISLPTVDEVVVAKDVQQTQLAVGYRTFGIADKRNYSAVMLDAIMGRGMSSRLFQEIREKHGISYDISSRLQFFDDAGMFTISAGVDPKKADLTIKLINREIEKICTKKVTEKEIARAKEYMIGNLRLSQERVVAKLFFHGTMVLSFGRLLTSDEQIQALRVVTPKDVQDVANSIFTHHNRSISKVVPKG